MKIPLLWLSSKSFCYQFYCTFSFWDIYLFKFCYLQLCLMIKVFHNKMMKYLRFFSSYYVEKVRFYIVCRKVKHIIIDIGKNIILYKFLLDWIFSWWFYLYSRYISLFMIICAFVSCLLTELMRKSISCAEKSSRKNMI